jgi:pimeloyl-ACP methyl ester carboxylesterase
MHVEVFGPDDGTPVVFMHGSMVAGWMWMGQVDDLPEYRCFLPDLPGIGNSAITPWVSFSDTSDKIANMISTKCPGGRAHIVGLSLGGITALHVAAKHPEVVESLIVSGVPYGEINILLRILSSVMLKLYSRPWGARAIASMLGIPRDESMEAFMKTALQTDPISLRSLTKEVFKSPVPENLDKVTASTLAVVGEKDTVPAKRAVLYLQDVMPNAAGYSVPRVGHQWNAENRKLFSEMIRLWVDSRSVPEQLLHIR